MYRRINTKYTLYNLAPHRPHWHASRLSAERNRQQLSRMLETGARLRLGGVIHVQQRGWAAHPSNSLQSHEASQEEEEEEKIAPCSSDTVVVRETRSGPEQNKPDIVRENGDIENQIYGKGEGEEGHGRDNSVRDGGVRGAVKKASARKKEHVLYSKEDLAKRKGRLLSQRYYYKHRTIIVDLYPLIVVTLLCLCLCYCYYFM